MKHLPVLLLLTLFTAPLPAQRDRFTFSVDLPVYVSTGEATSSRAAVPDYPGVAVYHPQRLRYRGPTLGVEVRTEYRAAAGLYLGLGAGLNVDPRERSYLGDGGTYQRRLLPVFVAVRKEWFGTRAWPVSLTFRGGHQVYYRRDNFRRATAVYTERGGAFAGTDLSVSAGGWALRPTLSVGASVQRFRHTNRIWPLFAAPDSPALPAGVRYHPYLVVLRTSLGFRF